MIVFKILRSSKDGLGGDVTAPRGALVPGVWKISSSLVSLTLSSLQFSVLGFVTSVWIPFLAPADLGVLRVFLGFRGSLVSFTVKLSVSSR